MRKKCVVVGIAASLLNLLAALFIEDPIIMSIIILLATSISVIVLYHWLVDPINSMKKKVEKMEEENRQLEAVRHNFVANVTHELKTPLTSIAGFIETLQDGAAEDPEIRSKFLDIIAIETARLKRLIEDTLVLSEIEQSKDRGKTRIHVRLAIQGVVTVMVPIAHQNKVEIIEDVDSNLYISGNEDRFRQMMVNLIENAIKYSNAGGRVWVEGVLLYGKVVITVRDEGIGIDEENLGRLFERFYRVDKSRSRKVGGTGLGLSIVKHIAALLEADVRVESQIGKGSSFIITFR